MILMNIGMIHYKKNNYKKALSFLRESAHKAKENSNKLLLKEIYFNLTIITTNKNDYKNALKYNKLYSEIKDSLFKENQIEAIAKMNAKFEISVKENENKIQRQVIKQQRILTFGISIILLLFVVLAYILYKSRKKQNIANQLLKEKNVEIINQNEEIQSQAEHLLNANDKINDQNNKLSKINLKITNSINYANRIQNAVLNIKNNPDTEIFFILNKALNTVSGDFFFVKKFKNHEVFAVADCTGHGVPGAFMSMLGISFLNEIVTEDMQSTCNILEILRDKVKQSLHQTGDFSEQKDGMDIAICIYDKEKNILKYSGANNSLLITRKNKNNVIELVEYEADVQPVGIYRKEKKFNCNTIKIKSGDTCYLFSDGYADQFGGVKNRKFNQERFFKLLISINAEPLNQQKILLDTTFSNWKLNNKQTDDILILGKKIIF